MGVAQNNSRSHFKKSVDEKETGLEKFFVDQNCALALGGSDEGNGGHVSRKARPGRVGDVGDGPAKLLLHFQLLVFGDPDVLT